MRQFIVGLSLIILGALTLLEMLGMVEVITGWSYISAALIIIFGLYLILHNNY